MRLLYLLGVLLIFSCSGKENKQDKILHYYDLKGYLEKEIVRLSENNPEVDKTWIFNDEKEDKRTKDIDWDKEFKVFKDFDINKSSFLTSYDSLKTDSSVGYRLKPNEKLPIKSITIRFDEDGKPSSIEAYRESVNMFFTTTSENLMELSNGEPESYAIVSTQKLLWFKPDSSKVFANILN